jgi:hypothetical protein
MKKEMKNKVLARSVLGLFVFLFAIQFVAAWTNADKASSDAGVNQPISNPTWLLSTVQFFDLGETWADMIVALAIALIIFAAAFDILEFTAFESAWVKYTIAGAIAAVFGVTGGIGYFAVGMVKLMGDSILIATFVAIVIAIFFFIGGSWAKGKMKKMKYKAQSEELEGLMELAATADAGSITKAKKMLQAAK